MTSDPRMALAIALHKEYPNQFTRIIRLVSTVATIMQRGTRIVQVKL